MSTRREFVLELAAVGAVLSAAAVLPFARFAEVPCAAPSFPPVVSFHMDRPYLDRSGTAEPYVPPSGARSAEPAAHLSEAEFRSVHCCV